MWVLLVGLQHLASANLDHKLENFIFEILKCQRKLKLKYLKFQINTNQRNMQLDNFPSD